MFDSILSTLQGLKGACESQSLPKLQQSLYRLSCFALENQQNRYDIVKGGGLDYLVEQLSSGNEYIQELALTCLLNLSLEERHKSLILYTPSILEDLVKCCAGSGNNDNRILACHCLQELANYNPRHCMSIMEAGGLKALVTCAKSPSLSLCRSAAKALAALCVGDYKYLITEAGVLDPLLYMLCSNSSDSQLPAIVCMWELATCPRISDRIANFRMGGSKMQSAEQNLRNVDSGATAQRGVASGQDDRERSSTNSNANMGEREANFEARRLHRVQVPDLEPHGFEVRFPNGIFEEDEAEEERGDQFGIVGGGPNVNNNANYSSGGGDIWDNHSGRRTSVMASESRVTRPRSMGFVEEEEYYQQHGNLVSGPRLSSEYGNFMAEQHETGSISISSGQGGGMGSSSNLEDQYYNADENSACDAAVSKIEISPLIQDPTDGLTVILRLLTISEDSAVKLFASLLISFLGLKPRINERIVALKGYDIIDSFIKSSGGNLNTSDVTWASHHLKYLKVLSETENVTLCRLSVLCLLNLIRNGLEHDMLTSIGLHASLRKLTSCGDLSVEDLALQTLSHLFQEPLSGSKMLKDMCSLVNDFEKLFNNSSMSDVVFVVGGEEVVAEGAQRSELVEPEKVMRIPAHSLILAQRSNYFNRMFAGDFKERPNSEVVIPNYHPDVFLAALKYLYTGTLDREELFKNGTKVGTDLLRLADQFDIQALHSLCEGFLLKYIDVTNVCFICDCADKANAGKLKNVCMRFMVSNLGVILDSEGFKHIYHANDSLVIETLRKVAEEKSKEKNAAFR